MATMSSFERSVRVAMRQSDALTLLAGNGNLVKRPFLVGDGIALVGFDAAAWQASLLR